MLHYERKAVPSGGLSRTLFTRQFYIFDNHQPLDS
jgi:hypothetical protein